MEPLRSTSVKRFANYEVSFHSGEVRKGGVRIRIQQQPMKLLEILLERPGEVVTREELRGRVWADESFGDFDQAVNIAIGKLRSALGDSAENPRFIETLPKRGYRFIAEVSVVAADDRTKRPESAAGDIPGTDTGHQLQGAGLIVEPKRRRWPARRVMGALAFALVLSLAILAVWLSRSRDRAPTGIRSLAVLPLDNLSGDASQDYFADGMTDELITDLAQIRALRVISRTSVMAYKHARKPLPEIAREVNSPALLLSAWLVTGFMTIVGALSYGELAAMMPKAGGQYVYLREAFSPLWGFLYGWTLFLVIQTGTIAAVSVGAVYADRQLVMRDDKEGKKRYALRKQTPEPVFGIIKSVLGFRQFHLRGLQAVSGEWTLVSMAWNLKRMFALIPAT